jgi:hypothetical protein
MCPDKPGHRAAPTIRADASLAPERAEINDDRSAKIDRR